MARSLQLITDSSIQAWLDFNGTLAQSPAPCPTTDHLSISNLSEANNCLHICNETYALWASSISLVTCGIWASLVATGTLLAHTKTDHLSGEEVKREAEARFLSVSEQLRQFHDLSLDLQMVDADYVASVYEAISDVFTESSDLGDNLAFERSSVRVECASGALFPQNYPLASQLHTENFDALDSCVRAKCSPRNLNADLSGIGVSLRRKE